MIIKYYFTNKNRAQTGNIAECKCRCIISYITYCVISHGFKHGFNNVICQTIVLITHHLLLLLKAFLK